MEKGKVLSLEDRIPKIKQHRKRKANRRLIFLLSLFFFLIALVVYFQSPLSHIKSIEIQGNRTLTEKELAEKSGLEPGEHLWKSDFTGAAAKLEEYPQVKKADVQFTFPNKVKILIEEFHIAAYLWDDKEFRPLLENGKLLKNGEGRKPESEALLLFNFKSGDVLTDLTEQLGNLPAEIETAISEIRYEPKKTDRYAIRAYMNDGNEVTATIPTFAEKMIHYPSIVSQLDENVKGVIDLEVGSFFKAYEEEEEEAEGDEGQ